MHDNLLAPLLHGDVTPLRTWLRAGGVDTEALSRLPWRRESTTDTALRERGTSREHVAQVVTAQNRHVAAQPGGSALLLLYLLHEVEAAWEVTYDFEPLWNTLRGACDCFGPLQYQWDRADGLAIGPVMALMQAIDQQIRAENAMTCGLAKAQVHAMQEAVDKASEALQAVPTTTEAESGLASYIRCRAAAEAAYASGTLAALKGLAGFYERGQSLAEAIATLKDSEDDESLAEHQVAVRELRAHRHSLTALEKARDAKWLTVDQGRLVYIYPFAIRGTAAEEVVSRALQEATGWHLGGVIPVSVHESVELSDAWVEGAWGRCYKGLQLDLPSAVLEDLDGQLLATLDVKVRFSTFGNHCVCLEAEIESSSAADLHSMMFRAAPECGVGRVRFRGESPVSDTAATAHARLADFAARLAEGVAAQLSGLDHEVQAITSSSVFHVISCVRQASLAVGPGMHEERREILNSRDLEAAVGSQVLLNPINSHIGSLAEWIRYPTLGEFSKRVPALTDERVVWTSNTTLLAGAGTADFAMDTWLELATFVASLEGLFAAWLAEVNGYRQRIHELEELVRTANADNTRQSLYELAEELEHEKLALQEFTLDVRSVIGTIGSPMTVRSPVVLAMMERLLEASRYGRKVGKVTEVIQEVLDDRLSANIDRLTLKRAEHEAIAEARNEQRQRAKLDTLLAVIAAIGFSGIGQILQDGYSLKAVGATWITLTIITLAVIVGRWFWWSATPRASSRSETNRDGINSRHIRRYMPRSRLSRAR
jgi:hypothetical protein